MMSTLKLPPVRSPPLVLVHFDDQVESLTKNAFFKNGRCYTLNNSNIKHELPPPKRLNPCVDQKCGDIDKWPAHSNMLPQSKPRFLLKLEAYLEKELSTLESKNHRHLREERLQVFRQVFAFFIENFRTYKPLLSAIKHEYESTFSSLTDTIKDLEPLKAMLVTLNDQCELKVLNSKQMEKFELTNLKNKNSDLHSTIAVMENEIAGFQRQIQKCQEEVAESYQKYRDEADARKLLIQDLNDLRYQQNETKRALAGGDSEEAKEEDPIILRLALKKAREDLHLKTQKLAEVLADYGDVVPRREFERLENQFHDLENKFSLLQSDHEIIVNEHSALLDVHKNIVEQRDKLEADCEKMRRSATPRPDWDKCGLYVEGGIERWQELTHETSTNDKVDILLSEMTGQDIDLIKKGKMAMIEFFEPKGLGDDIPLYLRSTQQIRKRRLTKRDVCMTIKEIWKEKIKMEGNSLFLSRQPMSDFVFDYLQRRFGAPIMIIEWGYNLHDAITRYNFDKSVALFGRILNKELDEDVYYCQLSQLEDLYRCLAKVDAQNSGFIEKEDFFQALEEHFLNYPLDDVSKVVHAAEEELGGFSNDQVAYRELFTEDDEGKTGPFINILQSLATQDKNKYLSDIEAFIETKSIVSSDDLREVFQKLDPRITPSLCDQYVRLASRNVLNEPSREEIMKNLRSSCIARS